MDQFTFLELSITLLKPPLILDRDITLASHHVKPLREHGYTQCTADNHRVNAFFQCSTETLCLPGQISLRLC